MRQYESISLWLLLTIGLTQGQFFHPTLDDEAYLDRIAREIQIEVDEAESDFLDQAKVVENATQTFIAFKLKQNAFNALRIMAEKELTNSAQIPGQRLKVPKQGDEVELSPLENAVQVNGQVFELLKLVPLIPTHIVSFLRDAFKIVFPSDTTGMKEGADKTKEKVKGQTPAKTPVGTVVEKAEKFRKFPPVLQLLGVLGLIADDKSVVKGQEEVVATGVRGGRVNRRRLEAEEQAKIQTLNFLKDFRKSFKLLDERSAAIYGGVQEAYNFLSNLRNVASHINHHHGVAVDNGKGNLSN